MGFNSTFKVLKCVELKKILVINLRKKIVYFYFNLKIVRFFCRTLYNLALYNHWIISYKAWLWPS